jgi:hypothetical protein
MSNWALIINPANKIEFRNLFNQLGSKETVLRNGYNNNNIELKNYSMTYEQKSIYSGQLSGTHELSDMTKLTWTGGYGYTNRQNQTTVVLLRAVHWVATIHSPSIFNNRKVQPCNKRHVFTQH